MLVKEAKKQSEILDFLENIISIQSVFEKRLNKISK